MKTNELFNMDMLKKLLHFVWKGFLKMKYPQGRGGQANFFLKFENCKSANSWAYFGIANSQISEVCQSANCNPKIFMINPQIRKFLQNTAQLCLKQSKKFVL